MVDLIKIMHCGNAYNVNGSGGGISEDIFGTGCDGNCTIEYNENTLGNVFLEAKTYNFNNLTICDGVKLRFCGEGVPILRVKNNFVNDGEIILRNPLLCNKTSFTDQYLKATISNKCNYLYSRALSLKNELTIDKLTNCGSYGGLGGPNMGYACSFGCKNGYFGGDGGNSGGAGSSGCDGTSGCCPSCSSCTNWRTIGGTGGTSDFDNASGGGGGGGAFSYSTCTSRRCKGENGCPAQDGIGGDGGKGGDLYSYGCNYNCSGSYANQGGGGGAGGFGYYKGGNGGDAGVLHFGPTNYEFCCFCSSGQGGNGGNSILGKGGDGGKGRNGCLCGSCGGCGGGMGGCSYYGDGGNGGEGLDYTELCRIAFTGRGGHSVFGNGGCGYFGGNSLYGNGGEGCCCNGSEYCGSGMDGGDVTHGTCTGRGGHAWGGVYGLGLFAKSITNNGIIFGRGGDAGKNICGYRCYCGTDGAIIRMVYHECCNTGEICLRKGYGCVNGSDGQLYNYQI